MRFIDIARSVLMGAKIFEKSNASIFPLLIPTYMIFIDFGSLQKRENQQFHKKENRVSLYISFAVDFILCANFWCETQQNKKKIREKELCKNEWKKSENKRKCSKKKKIYISMFKEYNSRLHLIFVYHNSTETAFCWHEKLWSSRLLWNVCESVLLSRFVSINNFEQLLHQLKSSLLQIISRRKTV